MKLHENQLLITSAGRSVDRVGPDGVSGELACQVRIAELNVSCVLVGGPGLLLALLDCGLVKPVSNAVDGEGTEADTATNGKNCLGEAGGESGKVVQLAVSVAVLAVVAVQCTDVVGHPPIRQSERHGRAKRA